MPVRLQRRTWGAVRPPEFLDLLTELPGSTRLGALCSHLERDLKVAVQSSGCPVVRPDNNRELVWRVRVEDHDLRMERSVALDAEHEYRRPEADERFERVGRCPVHVHPDDDVDGATCLNEPLQGGTDKPNAGP